MTEHEWLTSEDPAAMLNYLLRRNPESGTVAGEKVGYRTSERKLRRWCVAMACASYGLRHTINPKQGGYAEWERDEPDEDSAINVARSWATTNDLSHGEISRAQKAHLLRDIVGNPFRPVMLPRVPVYSVVYGAGYNCPWLTPTVLSLATAAYEERERKCDQFGYDPGEPHHLCARCHGTGTIDNGTLEPDRLAVLSDALEEAGCDDEAILTHLRSPGPHYRGIWSLDLILGRS